MGRVKVAAIVISIAMMIGGGIVYVGSASIYFDSPPPTDKLNLQAGMELGWFFVVMGLIVLVVTAVAMVVGRAVSNLSR